MMPLFTQANAYAHHIWQVLSCKNKTSRRKITRCFHIYYLLHLFSFYVRKQLLLSARLSHRNSVHLSVRLSVRLSHEWISQKRCKLESPNLQSRLRERL